MSLDNLRQHLGRTWIIVLFGIIYLVSQITILIVLGPVEHAMFTLQLTGFSAADYVSVFSTWEASGDMVRYRAHFILDDVHWVWYSVLFTALLSQLFERCRIPSGRNWFLLLPLASGLLDWYENRLQHVFLSSNDMAMIVDPLPLYSTLASDLKWLLVTIYVSTIVVLAVRLKLTSSRQTPA